MQTGSAQDSYGLAECQSIGLEGLTGNQTAAINDRLWPSLYPFSLGSGCSAWDEGKYPESCDIENPEDWCLQSWCYVDSENCVVSDGPY